LVNGINTLNAPGIKRSRAAYGWSEGEERGGTGSLVMYNTSAFASAGAPSSPSGTRNSKFSTVVWRCNEKIEQILLKPGVLKKNQVETRATVTVSSSCPEGNLVVAQNVFDQT
jgi:hypothetical protein